VKVGLEGGKCVGVGVPVGSWVSVGFGVLVGVGVSEGKGISVGASVSVGSETAVYVGYGVQVGIDVGVSVGVGVACATGGTCVVSTVTEDVDPNFRNPLSKAHQMPTTATNTTPTIAAPMLTIKVVCLGITLLSLEAASGLSRWVTSDVPTPAGGCVGCS
jgi:hypothetical protein